MLESVSTVKLAGKGGIFLFRWHLRMKKGIFLAFFVSVVHSWERKALQCWQCAAVPGYATQCPKDASLYELPEWNACMVWTLDKGNQVVLQNFVYSHSDCTKEKLDYWSEYIRKVWREPGSAKCCYENMCNSGGGDEINDDFVEIQQQLQKIDDPELDCTQCLNIDHAFCLAEPSVDPNNVRMDFDDMVQKMTKDPQNHVCNCAEGYLPVRDELSGRLVRCHDPIIKTAVIGGRCLSQEHCRGLTNSICLDDPGVTLPNGLSMKTCQCMSGYLNRRYSCDLERIADEVIEIEEGLECNIDSDCNEIENSMCNANGQCQCLEGFLPTYDDEEPTKLTWCKDPIVLTSSVGGYCLVPRHCSSLMGTLCMDKNPGEGGTFKRCECVEGLKPALPDPNSGIIKRCIGPNEEGVLSLISQALFGDDSSNPVPLKVNLKLTEKAILDSCKSTMTVVELSEWIPSEQFLLTKDNITDAHIGIVYAKFPNSALGHHGILIRLMSSQEDLKGNFMYSITLQRNRVMTIKKSFIDSQGNQRENVQLEEISNSYKWLNSDTYTGLWFLVKYGYISFGILDEHTLVNPMMQWKDQMRPYDVSVAGLTSEGSAVFYGVDCPMVNKPAFYPPSTCVSDTDCSDIPNTICKREIEPDILPGTTLKMLTCECSDGFEPIPDPFRVIDGGCFDPIKRTLTVNARCLSDRHCEFLKNTECMPTYQDASVKTCRCKKGTLPLTRLKDTGLVPGCEETELAKLLTVDSCKRQFTLGAITNWIPVTTMKMPYRAAQDIYSMAFYARFNGAANPVNTTIAIKLLDANKSPDKMYKVAISTTGSIEIYENVQGQQFLFGVFNRESLQVQDQLLDPMEFSPNAFQGFYVRYGQGTVSVGKIGQQRDLLQWTDTSDTALNGTDFVGFEVESGGNTEFGTVCFDVL